MPEIPQLTPIADKPLSVVLLARDQVAHVEAVVSAWLTYLNGLDRVYELLVVDDGSTDGTAETLEKLATSFRRVRLFRHLQSRGQGIALRTALAEAQHPLLFYTLLEPHFQPSDLGRFLCKRAAPASDDLEIDHVHVLSAARGGRRVPWFWRLFGSLWRIICRVLLTQAPERSPGWLGWKRHLAGLLGRILFGIRYHDAACPFRLVRRDVFQRIPLQSEGSFVHVEILAKANYLGLMMGEEMPLEPGRYPPLDRELNREEMRQLRTDARAVLFHPDFGPTRIVSSQTSSVSDVVVP